MKTFGSFLDEMMVANAAGTGGAAVGSGLQSPGSRTPAFEKAPARPQH